MRLKIRVKIYFLLHSPLFASLQSQRGVPCLAHHWWLRLYKMKSSLEVQILREDYHRILAQGLCLLSLDLWMLFIRGREMRCLEWRWEHVALVSFFSCSGSTHWEYESAFIFSKSSGVGSVSTIPIETQWWGGICANYGVKCSTVCPNLYELRIISFMLSICPLIMLVLFSWVIGCSPPTKGWCVWRYTRPRALIM